MTKISVTKSASYTTSDGETFHDRTKALAHEAYLARKNKIEGAELDAGLFFENEGGGTDQVLSISDLSSFIAKNADKIIAALTVKRTAGRRTKATAQQASA